MNHTSVDKMMEAMPVRMDHDNPMRMVQGGIASILADAAMAMATTTMLTNDDMRVSAVTTADLFAAASARGARSSDGTSDPSSNGATS